MLQSFAAPPQTLIDDADAFRERVSAAASGLLALLGIGADTVHSREHVLLANILERAWRDLTVTDEPPTPQAGDPRRAGCYLVPYEYRRVDALGGYRSGMPSPMFYQWAWEQGTQVAVRRAVQAIVTRLRRRQLAVSTADLLALEEQSQSLARLRGHDVPLRVDLLDGVRVEAPAWGAQEEPQARPIRIFLASSNEVLADRDAFELHFRQLNDRLAKRGVRLEIVRWETLLAAMSHDKKVEHGRLRFVMPTRMGHVELVGNVEPEQVRKALEDR